MTRINLFMLAGLILSSLYLVRTAYESRQLFAALDKARNEQRQLDADFKRLDAERQAQATNVRVEKVAKERLHMRTATPAVTRYVDDAAPAATAAKGNTP